LSAIVTLLVIIFVAIFRTFLEFGFSRMCESC